MSRVFLENDNAIDPVTMLPLHPYMSGTISEAEPIFVIKDFNALFEISCNSAATQLQTST